MKNLSSKEGKVRDQVLRFADVILPTRRAHNAVNLLAALVKLPKKVKSGVVRSVGIFSRIGRRIADSKIIISRINPREKKIAS